MVASLVTPLLPAQLGGAQAFLCDLAAGLGARGHRVTLYCAKGSQVPGVELCQVPVEPEAAQALVRPGGGPQPPSPALRRGFERLFDELRRHGADGVSQHAFDAEAVELAQGLPVLHTLHLPPVVPALVDAVRASADPFAAVSAFSVAQWRTATERDVRLLRNGVPEMGIQVQSAEPIALVAGRISPEKGTAGALRVARRAGLRPTVAGAVYDLEYFESEVRPHLEAGELRGPLPRTELWALMGRAAVTLMPVAWDEPFGLVAAESQLAGCPVAGYRRGALGEVVEEGVGGHLVEPGDEDALVQAARSALSLDRLAVQRAARRRLGLEASLDAYEVALREVAG